MSQQQEMVDKLEQELYCQRTGYTTALTVIPGGQKDGLDYGPVVVDVVVLGNDGDTIVYRLSTDALDEDWQIGNATDAVAEVCQAQAIAEIYRNRQL